MSFYYETRALGRWCPNKSDTKPLIKDGRLLAAIGRGPEVRAVQPVPEKFEHLPLDQLSTVLSPDGLFKRIVA